VSESIQPAIVGVPESNRRLIAPVWHTLVLILFLLAASAAGYFVTRRFVPSGAGSAPLPPRAMIPNYIATLIFEWVLFVYVYWGEKRYRGTGVVERIGGRWASGADVWRDIGLALALWLVLLLLVVGPVNFLLKPKGGEVVLKLLPREWWQLIPWTLISASAGFCEEYVFRGYLMEQFRRMTGVAWIAIVLQAAVFGFAHGYQGWGLMFSVFLLGLGFGIAAYGLKSLRVTMIAHGWTDFFSGTLGYLANHFHLLPVR
jgi:membrane protease YdiL (CAAX protease family)